MVPVGQWSVVAPARPHYGAINLLWHAAVIPRTRAVNTQVGIGRAHRVAGVEGTIAVAGLPPHRGLIVSLCFYKVPTADAAAPYGGDPPAEAATDCHEVLKQVDLDTETERAAYDLPFRIERPGGWYYLQVRAVLFRTQAGQVFAQAEQFFFGRRPIRVAPEPEGTVTLPVTWPDQSLEELHRYGTVSPQTRRSWWRFW
jgi:hypothetical protein